MSRPLLWGFDLAAHERAYSGMTMRPDALDAESATG
jgi:hypothetical protein